MYIYNYNNIILYTVLSVATKLFDVGATCILLFYLLSGVEDQTPIICKALGLYNQGSYKVLV